MKVLCLRYPRNAVTDILISLLCIFIILLILINADYRKNITTVVNTDSAMSFFEENGWMVDVGSCTESEKTIPTVFDDTYSEYAALQQAQGFCLEKYKGKKVTLCSYRLMNYPGYENSESIFINLMYFEDDIIGADIHCVSIDGFITGAVRNVNNKTG